MTFQVELVSPEAISYSGEAEMVIARTLEGGDIAFQPGHVPFIGVLAVWSVDVIRPDGNRREEAQPVGAVVDDVLVAGESHRARLVEARHQAQGQEAVGDRRTERAGGGPLDVDVDPLVVPGQVGEAVDHLLGDLEFGSPVAPGVLAAGGVDGVDVVEGDLVHVLGVLPCLDLGTRWRVGGPQANPGVSMARSPRPDRRGAPVRSGRRKSCRIRTPASPASQRAKWEEARPLLTWRLRGGPSPSHPGARWGRPVVGCLGSRAAVETGGTGIEEHAWTDTSERHGTR
jgi:F-type H+-transporting ATPase subunit epsilon